MSLSEKEFSTLTELCRIACSVEEKEVLFGRISQILTYVEHGEYHERRHSRSYSF